MIVIKEFLSVRLTLSLVHETTVIECLMDVSLKQENETVKGVVGVVHFDQMNRKIRTIKFHDKKTHQIITYAPRKDELDELTNRIDEYLGR